MQLSQQLVKQFEEQGYLILHRFFDLTVVDELLAVIACVVAEMKPPRSDSSTCITSVDCIDLDKRNSSRVSDMPIARAVSFWQIRRTQYITLIGLFYKNVGI